MTTLSPMDYNCPYIIESKLRNNEELQNDLSQYYKTISPKFHDFDKCLSTYLSNGIGLDLHYINCYDEYCSIVEKYVVQILKELNVEPNNFIQVMSEYSQRNDESIQSLLKLIYCDMPDYIIQFGNMMQQKYDAIYGINSKTTSVVVEPSVPAPAPVVSTSGLHVRILWDIENMSISKKLGGLNAVSKLRSFLESQHIHHVGVDTRITVFFNPQKSTISPQVIRELDRANVEMVWISSKREDADRKLTNRILQEIAILDNPKTTSFVIISSDQDYRNHILHLTQKGYKVYIIHNARSEKWKQTLEMSATKGFQWTEILNQPLTNSDRETDDIDIVASIMASATTTTTEATVDLLSKANRQNNKKLIGWIESKCIRWRGCYGFLAADKQSVLALVDSSPSLRQDLVSYFHQSKPTSDQSTVNNSIVLSSLPSKYESPYSHGNIVRVYCHHDCLDQSSSSPSSSSSSSSPNDSQQLHRGEIVNALVELGPKGLRAVQISRNGKTTTT